jgi:hypothetical protein
MSKSAITSIASELEKMPEHVEDARRALTGWGESALRTVRRYPGRSVLGAFAIGFVIAKLARRA